MAHEISPGTGAAGVIFGMSRAKVIAVLGTPLHVCRTAHPDIGAEESWEYDEGQLCVAFDGSLGFRAARIDVASRSARLKGRRVIGMTESTLLRTLADLGIPLELATSPFDPAPNGYLNRECGLSFRLASGVVCQVSVSPPRDARDRRVFPRSFGHRHLTRL